MPSRAATYPDITVFQARSCTGRDYRRTFVGGAVVGVSGVSAIALMAGTAAVAAAWMVSSSLSGNPEFRARAPIAAGMGLPRPQMRLVEPADMFGGALASANPAFAPEAGPGDRFAAAVAPAAAPAETPLPPARPAVASAINVPLPRSRPMQFAEVEARLQAEAKPDIARAATVPAARLPSDVIRDEFASAVPSREAPAPQPAQNEGAVYHLASEEVSVPVRSESSKPARRGAIRSVESADSGTNTRHAVQTHPVVYHLASAETSSPVRIVGTKDNGVGAETTSRHQVQSSPSVYHLASAEPAASETTQSINSAAKPAAAAAIEPAAKPTGPALAYNNPDVPARDNHTAIYDIVAHTVYMPDGERLEAHSGLGRMLDDPRYASAKARGPTPPNVYDLTLRRGSFHGVQAIRLNPSADSKMYGRDGILAHTYMLGPTGQSFGCVSFKHYDSFLRAFERGEVNRMVVVPHLQEPPAGVRAGRDDGRRYASRSENDY